MERVTDFATELREHVENLFNYKLQAMCIWDSHCVEQLISKSLPLTSFRYATYNEIKIGKLKY